jgi:3-deoxy-D-manno-octulosonic-acid transferase
VEFLIKKFLFLWKPDAIFLVDSEVWPNLILNASKYKIPLAVINARLTSKSFNKWIKFPRAAKKIFSLFDLCLASNLETKKYLEELGAKNIYFNGNIKLINKLDENKIENLSEKILLKNRFWIAASTHKGEDILCLKTHLKLKEKYNDIITIIAPRHIERSYNIKSLSETLNLKAQILNKNDLINEDKEIIIINTFGALQNFFKYAKSVFIGKSTIKKLENDGGQNPIDAAKLKCKIYHGPYVYNFKEIYEILEKNNIAKQIKSYVELSDYLIEDLKSTQKKDDQIANTINDLGQKTLTDTMKYINNFLFNEIK